MSELPKVPPPSAGPPIRPVVPSRPASRESRRDKDKRRRNPSGDGQDSRPTESPQTEDDESKGTGIDVRV